MLDGLTEGQILLADRAYDSNALREAMDKQGAWACVKPISTRKDPPAFSSFLYRYLELPLFSRTPRRCVGLFGRRAVSAS